MKLNIIMVQSIKQSIRQSASIFFFNYRKKSEIDLFYIVSFGTLKFSFICKYIRQSFINSKLQLVKKSHNFNPNTCNMIRCWQRRLRHVELQSNYKVFFKKFYTHMYMKDTIKLYKDLLYHLSFLIPCHVTFY